MFMCFCFFAYIDDLMGCSFISVFGPYAATYKYGTAESAAQVTAMSYFEVGPSLAKAGPNRELARERESKGSAGY